MNLKDFEKNYSDLVHNINRTKQYIRIVEPDKYEIQIIENKFNNIIVRVITYNKKKVFKDDYYDIDRFMDRLDLRNHLNNITGIRGGLHQ